MGKVRDLGIAPPDDPIFSEPWTVRPIASRPREDTRKAEEKRPTEEGSGSEDAADGGAGEEGQ